MVKKHARMDVWGRAQVVALGAAGWAPKAIRNKVWKPIGSKATSRAVRDILAKAAANPAWRGERGCAEFLVRLFKMTVRISRKEVLTYKLLG